MHSLCPFLSFSLSSFSLTGVAKTDLWRGKRDLQHGPPVTSSCLSFGPQSMFSAWLAGGEGIVCSVLTSTTKVLLTCV